MSQILAVALIAFVGGIAVGILSWSMILVRQLRKPEGAAQFFEGVAKANPDALCCYTCGSRDVHPYIGGPLP